MRSPSYIRNRPPIKRKRYNTRRIKQAKSYDVNEVCELLGVHKNTVRGWVRDEGMKPIDDCRPMLFMGAELQAFLNERQIKKKRKCNFNQIYCFKCRSPQELAGKMADLTFKTDKIAHLAALCAVCLTPLNRNIKPADIPKFEKVLIIRMLGQPTLIAPSNPSLNCDSK